MEENPSWEANGHSASQEIPRFLKNPKVNYRVQNSSPLVRILSQMHSIHTFPLYFPKIHSNIISPSGFPTNSKSCYFIELVGELQNFLCTRFCRPTLSYELLIL
jgi:hypothetical protein